MRRAAYAYAACRGGRAASNYENGKSDSLFHSAARRNWKNSLRFAGIMAPLFGFGAGAALLEKNRFLLPRKGEKGKPFLTLFFRSVTSRGRLIRFKKRNTGSVGKKLISSSQCQPSCSMPKSNRGISVEPLPCSIHFLNFLSIARSSLRVFVVRRTFVPHYF